MRLPEDYTLWDTKADVKPRTERGSYLSPLLTMAKIVQY